MSTSLYRDPTFEKVLDEEYRIQKCQACENIMHNGGCRQGYSSYYQCRGQVDGFKAKDE